jgi:regulator of protease activity HflC (stomatin/prohibitin superfamily)
MPDDYDDDFINDFKFVRHEKVDYVPPKEVVRTDQDMEEEKQEEEDKKAEEERTKQERAKKEHLPLGKTRI